MGVVPGMIPSGTTSGITQPAENASRIIRKNGVSLRMFLNDLLCFMCVTSIMFRRPYVVFCVLHRFFMLEKRFEEWVKRRLRYQL